MEITKNQKLLQTAVLSAWENAEFKKQLLASPVSAIETLTGEKFEIPSGKEFVILDSVDDSIVKDESKIYFNFPTKESVMETKLTDEQLEMVAGGAANFPCSIETIIIVSCFCGGDTMY
ncbi:TOMM propeptide domain-containing protein [Flavobacterium sp. SOK18b]|uniref:TOMM propeptide domain-containing protein n=1 Tax=Flavobacterium sp. SOK18b TaxID=797900 RepID=UPI0015FC6976|nr:TOMM propeptide domain-containing protein [Flavobacterium sp. SOK18b]MBB1194850.1 TOMM propeptide domain-containing protein [Flavobacterium sp. SOK18b]